MKTYFYLAILVPLLVLTGCVSAPQAPVAFDQNLWGKEGVKIGVVINSPSKTDLYMPGAGCLLCIATAEATNSGINKHIEGFDATEFSELKTRLEDSLKLRGFYVVPVTETIEFDDLPDHKSEALNAARKDYSGLSTKLGATHLLVVDINLLGLHRAYSSYIPAADPKGYVLGKSYIVDLNNNTYDWYLPIEVYRGVIDEWDEPPTYPGLTNAYYQAVESSKDMILAPFKK